VKWGLRWAAQGLRGRTVEWEGPKRVYQLPENDAYGDGYMVEIHVRGVRAAGHQGVRGEGSSGKGLSRSSEKENG
jgi:hypothetical protein